MPFSGARQRLYEELLNGRRVYRFKWGNRSPDCVGFRGKLVPLSRFRKRFANFLPKSVRCPPSVGKKKRLNRKQAGQVGSSLVTVTSQELFDDGVELLKTMREEYQLLKAVKRGFEIVMQDWHLCYTQVRTSVWDLPYVPLYQVGAQ